MSSMNSSGDPAAEVVGELLTRYGEAPEVLVAAPLLYMYASAEVLNEHVSVSSAARRLAASIARSTSGGRREIAFDEERRVAFALGGPSQYRMLSPLLTDLTTRICIASPPQSFRTGLKRSRLLKHVLGRIPRNGSAALKRTDLVHVMTEAIEACASATAVIEALRPHCVVVASLYSPGTRAMAMAARQASVPTVYLAKAPLDSDLPHREIPTDFAGLRGGAEVDQYVQWGAKRHRLDVVGDPGLPDLSTPPGLDPAGPVLFAPSNVSERWLMHLLTTLRQAVDGPVLVSWHPLTPPAIRASVMRKAPVNWREAAQPTQALLRAGVSPCLVQCSSGVALEALLHGVPVVEVGLTPRLPPPYLRTEIVPQGSSVSELRAAVRRSRGRAGDTAARRAMIDWGQQWCAFTGSRSVAAVNAVIKRALDEGAQAGGALVDVWR